MKILHYLLSLALMASPLQAERWYVGQIGGKNADKIEVEADYDSKAKRLTIEFKLKKERYVKGEKEVIIPPKKRVPRSRFNFKKFRFESFEDTIPQNPESFDWDEEDFFIAGSGGPTSVYLFYPKDKKIKIRKEDIRGCREALEFDKQNNEWIIKKEEVSYEEKEKFELRSGPLIKIDGIGDPLLIKALEKITGAGDKYLAKKEKERKEELIKDLKKNKNFSYIEIKPGNPSKNRFEVGRTIIFENVSFDDVDRLYFLVNTKTSRDPDSEEGPTLKIPPGFLLIVLKEDLTNLSEIISPREYAKRKIQEKEEKEARYGRLSLEERADYFYQLASLYEESEDEEAKRLVSAAYKKDYLSLMADYTWACRELLKKGNYEEAKLVADKLLSCLPYGVKEFEKIKNSLTVLKKDAENKIYQQELAKREAEERKRRELLAEKERQRQLEEERKRQQELAEAEARAKEEEKVIVYKSEDKPKKESFWDGLEKLAAAAIVGYSIYKGIQEIGKIGAGKKSSSPTPSPTKTPSPTPSSASLSSGFTGIEVVYIFNTKGDTLGACGFYYENGKREASTWWPKHEGMSAKSAADKVCEELANQLGKPLSSFNIRYRTYP